MTAKYLALTRHRLWPAEHLSLMMEYMCLLRTPTEPLQKLRIPSFVGHTLQGSKFWDFKARNVIKAGLGNHKRDYLTSLSSIDRRAILPINIALHSYAKCKNSTHLVSYLINELRGASSSLSIVCKFPIPSGSSLSSTAHWHSHVRLRHCSLKRWTAWPGLSPTLVNASPRVTWLTWWRWPRRGGIRGTNRNMMPQEQG